jgi:PAS domain S-box-containing protein
MAERSSSLSEKEFILVNEQLKNELTEKKISIEQLKEAIIDMGEDGLTMNSDNLLDIVGFLKIEVAKRKQAENILIKALESTGDGVWEYNIQTKEVFFSRQFKKMLGYEEDEFENKREAWLKIIKQEDIYLVSQTDEAYLKGIITSHQREYRIKHKNGHYIWILDRGMVISYTSDGSPERIVGTHTDITERKLSEQMLLIREEKYRNIIANMNLGLTEMDNDGLIQYANLLFCKMSGYNPEELLGKKAELLFSSPGNKDLIKEKSLLWRKGISDAYEIEVRNRNGEVRWWLISGAPRYNDSGELVGSIGIYLDFTDRKKLEFDLYEAREQAEQSARTKEIFLANMSHEIRTPMNAILGMSHQLKKTSLNETQYSFLNTILTATDHLMVVINDILDMSKIQAGMLSLESIGFNLKHLITHTKEVILPKALEKGITLNIDVDEGISKVLIGDPHRLNQILLNLLSNAIKFTERGGISLCCKLLDATSEWQSVYINIKDTGIGMDEDFMSNLFEKFAQEDKSIARKYGGTGLGMAITKQLIDLMNGSIDVKSKKGSGTEVSINIRFPIGLPADVPEVKETLSNSSILNGLRILLVEDYELNRLLVRELLRQYKVRLSEAANGADALKLLLKESFDLVLMDIQMPVMSGMEAIEIIRKNLKMDIPVIALTANAIKGENKRCIEAGMNAYISKPFSETELVNMIADCITPDKIYHSNKSIQESIPPDSYTLPDTTPSPINLLSGQKQLFNLARFEKIAGGDRVILREMIDAILSELPASIEEIRKAYNNHDFAGIGEWAHTMKPTILMLEISSLQETVHELEMLRKKTLSLNEVKSLVEKLESVISEVIEKLADIVT